MDLFIQSFQEAIDLIFSSPELSFVFFIPFGLIIFYFLIHFLAWFFGCVIDFICESDDSKESKEREAFWKEWDG